MRLRRLKVGSPRRTLCSQCSVSVIVKAETEHVSSVKLISSLTLQTLVTANILGSPGSDQMDTDGQSVRLGKNVVLLQPSSIRNSFETASLHVESIPVVSDCTSLAALPPGEPFFMAALIPRSGSGSPCEATSNRPGLEEPLCVFKQQICVSLSCFRWE